MIQAQVLSAHLVPCTIRDYTPEDHEACVAVYASNVPHFYPETIMEECTAFLAEGTSYLLVVEHDGQIVGCGGLELRGEGPFAHLVQGFIHRDHQGKGFGSTLLAARLSLIEHEDQAIAVQLEAAGSVAPFFALFGFELAGVRANRFGDGQASGQWVLKVRPEDTESLQAALEAKGVKIHLTDPVIDEADSEDFEE